MKNLLLSSLAVFFAGAAAALDVNAFKTPPQDVRPETWFHFIGGNVAEKGIVADLEAIKGVGIGGVQLFHGQFGGPWPGVSPQIQCLSAPWDGLVGRVADEAKSRGLRFTMQNCPGWAMSGGPWIKPENAMRHLVTSVTIVDGKTAGKLPQAAKTDADWQDYREVAVLAFPMPAGEDIPPLKPVSARSNLPEYELADWIKGKGALNLRIDSPERSWFEFTFDKPVTVRTVDLPPINSLGHGWCYVPDTKVRIEAATPAGLKKMAEVQLPQGNWQEENFPLSLACDEMTAQTFRVTVLNGHPISLQCPKFFSQARTDDWRGEACWTLRGQMNRPAAKQDRSAWVDPARVVNLTHKLAADGTLAWTAPTAGKWVILRVGHVNTGAKNGPAPAEGTGFECDKLSPRGADIHFANYIGRLSRAGGAVHGKLDAMLLDSWECRRQTWTAGLDADFAKRCGYDLFTWMPALFGYVMGDPLTTRRFLRDWRGLISDCIANKFYGRMAELAHQNGLQVQFETAFGDVVPGDIMEYYKHADVPMCEFWSPRQENYVGSFNFKPVKPTVSAAHLYGKPRVAAEAFTSFSLTWNEKLRDLKQVANLHFAEGVSHLIFHTYTHNPRTDWLPPGTSFGSGIGTPFLRGQTWWKHMPEFTDYLSRCGTMLEQGKPVSDVLWYLGDMLDHKPREDAPFPKGYRFDYCNPDALLTRVSVKDGLWCTPDGITYRVLWLPKGELMLPETLEKIVAGLDQGGRVALAALPAGLATQVGGAAAQARFDRAVAALKAAEGKGRLTVGQPLEQVLAAAKIMPDVVQVKGVNGIVWNHRADEEADWYFVAADNPGGFAGDVSFRATGAVQVFDPVTGASEAAYGIGGEEGRTTVSLALDPSEARFVVFRRNLRFRVAKPQVEFAPACAASSAYKVVSARYGALDTKDRWLDAAPWLQQALDRGARTFTSGNGTFGRDPAYRTKKSFEATVKGPDGKLLTFTCGENGSFALPVTARPAPTGATAVPVAGPWRLSFPAGWGAPATQTLATLAPWKDLDGSAEAKAFSGTGTYATTFTVEKAGARTWLDLGRVESLAVVRVNGRCVGRLWCEPYRVEVTEALKAGTNTLEVEVTDTWYNRLVFDAGQPEDARKTWTINGPGARASLIPSGLLGPVVLYVSEK